MIDVRARDNSGARNGLRLLLRGLSATLAILFVTSCGNNLFIAGTPVITLTAQRGNFTSYIISIDQIYLTRKDGTIAPLPLANERVDLAQQTGFVQLLMAPPVQEGTYVSATFSLDYGGSGTAPLASVTIDDNGVAGATTLIDATTGTTPTVDTITVTFDPANPLVVGNQTSSLINFNIDLEASNTINISNGIPAIVTTHPIITATAAPVYQQPIFVRGLFVFADTNAGNFVMNTRPLRDAGYSNGTYTGGATTGAITVLPNAQTYYNIDGVTYVGAAGIAQLSALKAETASLQIAAIGTTTAIGGLNQDTPTFTATEVYAGTSLESTIQDHITGIVAGRSGDTITLNAASLVDRIGDWGFTQSIPITLAPTTIVSVDGVASPSPTPTIGTISIGQYIEVSGVVNPTGPSNGYVNVNPDGSFNPTGLDATNGQVRIKPTTLWGTLNSATPGSASVSLNWIQNYEPSFYNFTGAGTNTSATNYTINTGTTDLSATAPGTLLNFVGLTNAYGSGPPDFTATSVTPATSFPQQLIIEWSGAGSNNPFTVVAGAGLYVNLQDANLLAGAVHVLRTGPFSADQDITKLPNPNPNLLVIVPANSADLAVQKTYQFSVGNVPNGIYVYSAPADFAARVLYNIGAIGPTDKLVATGQYDGAGNFVATNIEIDVH
jgi:hypothetical protein